MFRGSYRLRRDTRPLADSGVMGSGRRETQSWMDVARVACRSHWSKWCVPIAVDKWLGVPNGHLQEASMGHETVRGRGILSSRVPQPRSIPTTEVR